MKLLFDFFPIFVFFISYKFFGIYAATAIFLAASFIQTFAFWLKHRRFEKMHLITFIIGSILGTATLVLHNVMFIKWKPTAVYWALSIAFLITQLFTHKPLLQTMMESTIALPKKIWNCLNLSWAIFFIFMGALNLFVVYHYDTNTWVDFKLFGLMSLTLIFILAQAFVLNKYGKIKE